MKTDEPLLANFLVGFKMVSDNIFQVLNDDGVTEIEALGTDFNPKYHHAIETVCDDNYDDSVVVEVIQTGYLYKDKIIRPALVKVNKLEKGEKENEKNE